MEILIFLLMLSFLVIIHELGHFVTARWMKVKIEELGIGYPPRALTLFRWKGIPFTLNWLPFGGFVKMQGEDGEDGEERREENGEWRTEEEERRNEKEISNSKKNNPAALAGKLTTRLIGGQAHNPQPTTHNQAVGPFYTKSKRARLLVLLAGVFVNFVFGFFAFSFIYTRVGIPTPSENAKIQFVAEGSPAQQAGLETGDTITAYIVSSDGVSDDNGVVREEGVWDQISIDKSNEFIEHVNANLGKDIVIVVQKPDGESAQKTVYARTIEERTAGEGAIGVAFESMTFTFYPWWQMPFRGMWVGMQQSVGLSVLIVQAFGQLFFQLFTQAQLPSDIAGPVGIVHQASKTGAFAQGPLAILNFAAMLSINLAILNILPIPALDGGRALFVILETVIGKKWRQRIEGRLNYMGFALLLLLIVVITAKDIWSVIRDIWL